MNKFTTLSLAAALLGAVSLAGATAPAAAVEGVKCYGIAKAGENDCANASGSHSCAGHSTVDHDGGEWKATATAEACSAEGGQLEAFAGVNPAKKS